MPGILPRKKKPQPRIRTLAIGQGVILGGTHRHLRLIPMTVL